MDSEKRFAPASLPDDLLVEILCRVPFKSFCRFKCVCKAWLAFSSDPHYRRKLPKTPTGLIHQGGYMTGIQLVSLSPNNEEINGALTYLPGYKHLEIVDCCNGLVLCKSGRYLPVPEYTCRFIVCNPATREWRYLPVPESQRHPCGANAGWYTTILAFDPSWSAQSFYVFNFRENFKNILVYGISRLEVFSSDLSTWLVDDAWSWDREIVLSKPHNFIGGALHVHTWLVDDAWSGEILVVDGLNRMSSGIPPNKFTIKLPHDHCRLLDGCFGQSSRSLLCAWPEECGHTVEVFSLDANCPCKWSLKHRITMPDAFGRDNIIGFCDDGSQILQCSYRIVALDSETEVLFLVDKETYRIFSYNINTMKVSEIQDGCLARVYHYVACYSKLPGRAM